MPTLIRSHPLGDGAPAAGALRRPSIVPTRRRIDRRFSSLGFTISATQPWVEVLLATDPTLFDPGQSPARTPANFYASRSHGGLTATTSGRARYVAPAGVVATLAASGRGLWFLAVAYDDSTGVGGTTSSETGASGMVLVDASLRPGRAPVATRRALAHGRGLSLDPGDRLEGEDGADVSAAPPAAPSEVPLAGSAGVPLPGGEDLLEGEDGADLPQTALPSPEPGPEPGPAPAPAAVTAEGSAPSPAPATAPEPAPEPATVPPAATPDNGTTPVASLADLAYDDGWDSVDTGTVPALAAIPASGDEYPDIDWGGPELDEGGYGAVPAYQSLDEAAEPAPDPAPDPAPASVPVVAVPAPRQPVVLPTLDLPAETQRRVIELTAADNGNAYAAVNADGPFRGRHGPGHKAYQRFHTGLSYGIAEFNQDSGSLGQLLRLMQQREPETFAAVFGDDAAALVATATAPGPSGEHAEGGRGPRVQPVAGADLWEEPWLSRFRAAGAVPGFRAAQNQLAAELYLAPMLTVAAGFGLSTERALCMVLDRAIALGEQGAKRWLADTVGPVKTPALRQSALAALGFDSIEAFQAAVPGLLLDGEFGPVTHATLTAALRLLGPAAPLPLPGARELVEEMARRGQGEEGGARLLRIATSAEFGDTPIGG